MIPKGSRVNPSPALQRSPGPVTLACPATRQLRDRLRAMASDLVAGWRADGMPAAVRTAAGLRGQAETLVARAGGTGDLAGWMMVTIVSEYWRERIAAGPTAPMRRRSGRSHMGNRAEATAAAPSAPRQFSHASIRRRS